MIYDYCDMEMILSGRQQTALSTILENRRFVVVYVNNTSAVSFMQSLHLIRCGARLELKRNDIEKEGVYILLAERNEESIKDLNETVRQLEKAPVFDLRQMSIQELMQLIQDKELVFRCDYVSFGGGNVENTLNKELKRRIFMLKEKNDYYMVDEFYDIRIFLWRMDNTEDEEPDCMKPSDIRDYDIDHEIISVIKEQIDDPDALFIEYEAVSKEIQAKYLVVRFHSNPLWDKNPVCIMNYRLSAYILPGTIHKADFDGIDRGRLLRDVREGREYAIDSIYCNSDICQDKRELYDLICGQFYGIAMA